MFDRSYETMTSKERVNCVLRGKIPDRVPINYMANPGIDARLKKALGLREDQTEELYSMLGVDFRGISVRYTGPVLHTDIPDRKVEPLWGYHLRWVEHQSGGYWDYCDFPLQFADVDEVANWPMPNPDDYDYDSLIQKYEKYKDFGVYIGDAGLACIINTAGFFRGMEQVFVDLITDDPAGLLLIDRFLEVQYEVTRRSLEKIGDRIDFVWMGEDLGTQAAPLISMELFKKHILPRQKRFFDLAKSYDLPVLFHTCGSSSWAYDAYYEAGLSGVDTLQPEAANMSPKYLKEKFGGRLFFHGCISTAGKVAYGTVEDTQRDVREVLEIMMPGGGYCMSPTHLLQDNTPTENVIALYETALKYGRYQAIRPV